MLMELDTRILYAGRNSNTNSFKLFITPNRVPEKWQDLTGSLRSCGRDRMRMRARFPESASQVFFLLAAVKTAGLFVSEGIALSFSLIHTHKHTQILDIKMIRWYH
jgi:hypothetical protein